MDLRQDSTRTNASSSNSPTDCLLHDVGRQRYSQTLKLQLELHGRCKEGSVPGAMVAVEHEPVITMGVRTAPGNLLADAKALEREGIEVVQTDRGGDITYHGPGQLVVYPILNLKALGSDVHTFLRLLEESVILTLRPFGVEGHRHGLAGVWTGNRKICSIGVAVRRSITYHGLALNISPNMKHFTYINPCGLQSSQMTSLAELVRPRPALTLVKDALLLNIAQVFDLNLIIDGEANAAI
jgi:lipoyl(octanoyl) transferase